MVMVVPSRVTSVWAAGLRTGLSGVADCLAGMSMLDIWAEAGRAALRVAAERRIAPYGTLQPEYNLYDREGFEGELQRLCVQERLGVLTYFSLASGFLTGKYRSQADQAKSQRGKAVEKYLTPRGTRVLRALDQVAARHEVAPAQVALAWILAQDGVTAPIASATTPQQLATILGASRFELSSLDLAQLSATGP